jgi:hypothetical protein
MYLHISDILEDIKEECSKYGNVKSLEIPRPGFDNVGVGKVSKKDSFLTLILNFSRSLSNSVMHKNVKKHKPL